MPDSFFFGSKEKSSNYGLEEKPYIMDFFRLGKFELGWENPSQQILNEGKLYFLFNEVSLGERFQVGRDTLYPSSIDKDVKEM